ncbi:MAG: fructokinase [Desulforhopalus sp.]|jgi:fructokinase
MNNQNKLFIFGEVLFDCFPTGEKVLGGAPFNVAWNLHSFGDEPRFISRIGKDDYGYKILTAMQQCGMNRESVQIDEKRPTGLVEVTIQNNEPRYNIVKDSAYDFIDTELLPDPAVGGILYHGTLCLRNKISRNAYDKIRQNHNLKIFIDVNLRSPWWQKDDVLTSLNHAHWVKMNEHELDLLIDTAEDIHIKMSTLQKSYKLEQVIITRGAKGTIILTDDNNFHSQPVEKVEELVDTVGAGDAFSSVYIHGLRACWPVDKNLHRAQQFAGKVIGLRGATTTDLNFYQEFMVSIAP